MALSLESFVKKTHDLLEKEREAELEETRLLHLYSMLDREENYNFPIITHGHALAMISQAVNSISETHCGSEILNSEISPLLGLHYIGAYRSRLVSDKEKLRERSQ